MYRSAVCHLHCAGVWSFYCYFVLFRVFIRKGWMFKFIKGFFSTFIEMIMWFGALNSTYTETSLHSWNETNLIMHELLNVLVNLACKYFTEDIHICVYLGNWGPSFLKLPSLPMVFQLRKPFSININNCPFKIKQKHTIRNKKIIYVRFSIENGFLLLTSRINLFIL